MKKILLSSIITIILVSNGYPQRQCRCKQVSDQETVTWAFDTIQIIERQPIRKIYGKVTDSIGAAIPGSLIEFYPLGGDRKKKDEESGIKRIAACTPMEDGDRSALPE